MSGEERSRPRSAEWFRKVDDLFAHALDLAPQDRADFLARETGDDSELLRDVKELLAASAEEDSLLQSGGAAAFDLLDEISPDLKPHQPRDRVGRYRLIREIGRGGMGVVYLAERADGAYEQQVALKVMRLGAGPDALARFTRERQILARLEHPHIARLLDGGVSETGHPFLVVEYVEGEEITSYCASNKLGTKERLGLFCAVCEAIESAHRQLVVHRDIKPSNILVTTEGQVKLLDFGIAKLLESTEDEAGLTHPGSSAMTPRYASPEQIEGLPVTVASDVYQLGILGYELLVGQRPFEPEGTSPREVWLQAREQTLPLASKLASQSDDRSVRERGKELSRDLDAVLLKALRKSTSRRYGSVDRLREDIERWLQGLPVQARPDSLVYRLRKFIGRHRAAVVVGVAALIGLLALSTGFVWRLTQERDQTILEAQRARQALAVAEELRTEGDQVLDFLEGLFEVSDPIASRGESLTARDLLHRGAEKIEVDLAEQPAVRARMMHTLGNLYAQLGLYSRSEELLLGARELLESDPTSRAYAETTSTLGFLYYDTGEWGQAATLLQEARTLLEAAQPTDDLAVAEAVYRLAIVRGDSGEPEVAEGLYRQALDTFKATRGPRSYEVARVLNSMAINANSRGFVVDAESLYLQSLAIHEELFGHEDPRLGKVLNNLGLVYGNLGRWTDAVEFLERALQTRLLVFEEDHPDLATVRMNLAIAYLFVGELEKGDEQLVLARPILRQSLDPEHPTFVDLEITLGRLRRLQGRQEESLAHLESAHRLALQVYGEDHERTARSLGLRGKTLMRMDRLEESKEVLNQALETYERMGFAYPQHDLIVKLGEVHGLLGELEQAEGLLRASLLALEKPDRSQGSQVLQRLAADLLAQVLREQGEEAEALRLEERYEIERGAAEGS